MSEEQNQVDISLPEHAEKQIQDRWIGLTQSELGVLQTNYFMAQARIEALNLQRAFDLQLIEGLKKRAFVAEDNIRILQGQLKEAQEKLVEKPGRKSSKTQPKR